MKMVLLFPYERDDKGKVDLNDREHATMASYLQVSIHHANRFRRIFRKSMFVKKGRYRAHKKFLERRSRRSKSRETKERLGPVVKPSSLAKKAQQRRTKTVEKTKESKGRWQEK
jgi:hypothetical protein